MSTDRPRRCTEDGGALIGTLLAILILSAITVILTSMAVTESRATGSGRDFETAVHAAESGADNLITRLNDNSGYQTGHVRTATAAASPEAEREWAIDQFEMAQANPAAASSATLLQTPAGPAFGIRPTDALGVPLDMVYGVAEVPSGTQSKIRVVKMLYDRGFYAPEHALLAGCDLTIAGSPMISGAQGNVHSNCDLDLNGVPVISGSATASGTLSPGGTVGPGSGGGQPVVTPPSISARSLYDERFAYDGSGAATYDGTWFDLCPDGSVRAPAAAGGLPCSSTTILSQAGAEYRGWRLSGDNWDLSGNQGYSGVYYVYQRSAKISGHPGMLGTRPAMTVITEANPNDASNDYNSGSIEVSGNPRLNPHLQGVLFLADRDLVISGNPDVTGFLAAHEQIKISGNPTILGAIVAEDAVNQAQAAGGASDGNSVSGNPTITYDGGLSLPFSASLRITAWQEL